ncbi:MAG: ATP-binding protein, partial [Gemmatimonadota bacterium]|nr:ATP-binding protein [Gemmatimonadota bacterium]
IQTHVDCGNAPAEVRIQETQFNQMLVNLLKNAMEAIEELKKSGGLKGQPRIEIRACIQQEFFVLEVQDNGIGIEQKNLKAIFGAGYTTKQEGSGLGLHSAANFVTGSGGKIQPLSDGYGTGTTMRVSLRLNSADRDGEATSEPSV